MKVVHHYLKHLKSNLSSLLIQVFRYLFIGPSLTYLESQDSETLLTSYSQY